MEAAPGIGVLRDYGGTGYMPSCSLTLASHTSFKSLIPDYSVLFANHLDEIRNTSLHFRYGDFQC